MSLFMDRARWLWVEFIVVSLGVLSALLVDTWIQEREDQQKATVYRTSLIADLETDIAAVGHRADYYGVIRDFGLYTLDVMQGRNEATDAEFLFAAFNAAEQWDFVEQASTYLDMRATGHLDLLGDLELRVAISRYYREMIPRHKLWSLPEDYRRLARGIIPNDLQAAIHEQCTSIKSIDSENMRDMLQTDWITTASDPSCLGDTSGFELAEAAELLRNHPDAERELRYRISQANVAIRLFGTESQAAKRLRDQLAMVR